MLADAFGRVATDLRISLTDRCQLRCTYCMPAEGLKWLRKLDLLTDAEIVRLAGLFVTEGVRAIRLTGGEPTAHPRLPAIIAALAALTPRPELSVTTNGVTLAAAAPALAAAGLDRVNVSLDTLDRETYRALTRRDRLADVLAGVAAADAAGLRPVKINAVLMRGVNLAEAPALLEWALRAGYQLRFIEHMPLDPQHGWNRATMVTAEEILALLSERFTLRAVEPGARESAPAELFEVLDGPGADARAGGPGAVGGGAVDRPGAVGAGAWAGGSGAVGTVGVIGSVTRPFCRRCDRVRITADGQLRTCLFARAETDLRGPLRDGGSDAELIALIRAAVAGKQSGHAIGAADFVQPERPMSAIGG
ncbi:MAG: GTP 3',8-cyclase MoaA [Actinomycetia bacterium]|nr:GTP 3',8-cyclase MoaA [Actinomycetes bacterium]